MRPRPSSASHERRGGGMSAVPGRPSAPFLGWRVVGASFAVLTLAKAVITRMLSR